MKATTGADQERLEPSQTPYHRCQVLRLQLSYWLYPPSTDEYPIPFLTCEASFSPSPNKRVDPSERLWLGKEALTEEWMHWLQIVSGVFVILLGTWMLWRRLSFIARIKRLQIESQQHVHHHGAPDPFVFNSHLAQGVLEIINTPHGERFRMSVERASFILKATVKIMRDGGRVEEMVLVPGASAPNSFESDVSPEEPHEFSAVLLLEAGETEEALSFKMLEPAGHGHGGHDHGHEHGDHGHSHDQMTDDEHARAHAATLPEYVKAGVRPLSGKSSHSAQQAE